VGDGISFIPLCPTFHARVALTKCPVKEKRRIFSGN
jgi:hypothetical protein